jgi:2-polyprenyl-3-methyl-5-hydroxy-6-metoxy-1,4-benzoquinol methylase
MFTTQESNSSMQSPLSESPTCSLIKTIDPGEIAARWRNELSIDWIPDPALEKIQYWCDNESGFYFYVPQLAAGDENLYIQLQRFPWYYMEHKWEFSQAIRLLKKSILTSGPRLLEIGVGRGAFLQQAQKAGFDISGVELNPDGAESARSKGFVIYEEDLSSLCSDHADAWDALCAFQVLEHLPEPRAFLEQALILLKPGGSLILSVPNADIASWLDPARTDLLDQPPHHMSHWNEKVFKRLEALFPIRLAEISFEPLAPYHIDWFISAWGIKMREAAGRIPHKIIFNRLSLQMLRAFLAIGPRKLIRGHTLLVRLVKL